VEEVVRVEVEGQPVVAGGNEELSEDSGEKSGKKVGSEEEEDEMGYSYEFNGEDEKDG